MKDEKMKACVVCCQVLLDATPVDPYIELYIEL